jgi:hypothetical protein
VHVYGVFDDVVPKLVGFPKDKAFLYPCSGHPDDKALGVVIAAVVVAGKFTLGVRSPAKLTSPYH